MKKNLLFVVLILMCGLLTTNAQYIVFDDVIVPEGAELLNAGSGAVNTITEDAVFLGTSAIQISFAGPEASANWAMSYIRYDAGVDLNEYADGYLNFAMKTTSTSSFNIRVTDGSIKPKIDFIDGADPYGFMRDGEWHTVSIPIADYLALSPDLDLTLIKELFVWRGGATDGSGWIDTEASDFYIDHIHFSDSPFATGGGGDEEFVYSFEEEADVDAWEIFSNGAAGESDLAVVENPDKTGLNSSEMALRFIVNADADPWVGMKNEGSFLGENALVFTEENHIMSMLVYKTKQSDVLLKLEADLDGGDPIEVRLANTMVDEWEELVFDFAAAIGKTFEKLVVFPDFPVAREEGTIVYLDNIKFVSGGTVSTNLFSKSSVKIFPNPTSSKLNVQHADMTGITIRNIAGQTVRNISFHSVGTKTIEVGDLNSGVYFLSVKSESGLHTSRFIKK